MSATHLYTLLTESQGIAIVPKDNDLEEEEKKNSKSKSLHDGGIK